MLVFLFVVASAGARAPLLQTPTRLVFDGPVTHAAPRDEQKLWVVSRGRLFELDACGGFPREVALEPATPSSGPRRRRRDPEEALMLASLDEGDWDEQVIEDYLDDEGIASEGPRRHPAHGQGDRARIREIAGLGRDAEGTLWVRASDGLFRCDVNTAACRRVRRDATAPTPEAPAAPSTTDPPPSSAAAFPRPVAEELGPTVTRHPAALGSWLITARGVWFEVLDAARDEVCAYLRPSLEPDAPSPRQAASSWAWVLPRFTLAASRSIRAAGKSETLVLLLLAFSPGRSLTPRRPFAPAPLPSFDLAGATFAAHEDSLP